MAALQCDICGGKLVMGAGGIAVCDSCGMEHSKDRMQEKVQEIKGTVKIDGPVQVDSVDFVIRAGKLEKYNGAASDVLIPENVAIIAATAFQGCTGLTSVTMSDNVTEIEGKAFCSCPNLKQVVLSNNVKRIIRDTFSYCASLISVKLPDGLLELDGQYIYYSGHDNADASYYYYGVFTGCTSLESINIPETCKTIGDCTFYQCSSLHTVNIPERIEKIGDYAFAQCSSLRTIIIPDSIDKIGTHAFSETKLQKVTISERVFDKHKCCFADTPFYDDEIERTRMKKETENFLIWKSKEGERRKWTEDKSPKKSGCYIATAIYGSYDAPQVFVLRQYRDKHLSKTVLGRTFIRVYYQLSPPIARWMKGKVRINKTVRRVIDCIVACITNREDM